MKKLYILLFCIIILFLLCSCGATPSDEDISAVTQNNDNGDDLYGEDETFESVYIKISVEQAREIMETEKYILLDVRTEDEYRESRIEGAILIPDYEITERAEFELPDKNALILIYCRSGRRSANVAEKLINMGYMNIYDFGGILDWTYETING